MNTNRVWAQGATLLVTAGCLALLNACGSGAVSAPAPTNPSTGTPLAVSPPTADLFPDLPTTFTITGGTAGYTAFSSNNAALPITAAVVGSTFTVIPNAVTAETAVDITVRDAANTSASAKATVKPSTLSNQITFTPFGPTATGCGTNALCSGGDAQIVVTAIQNGVILRNRPIRFDVFQGSFQLVTPGSGVLVNSLVINTDDQGAAVARLTATTGAATQVATIQTTDVTTGLPRRFNFNIVQQVSGTGILSTLPSGGVTFTGAKGSAGADGLCPTGLNAIADFYIFGGTPPYNVVSPLTGVATVSPSVVTTNGGKFTAQAVNCGKVAFIITDATGRTIETGPFEAIQGAKGETTADALTIAPTGSIQVACGGSNSITVSGSGRFSATYTNSGPAATTSNSTGFVIAPPSGAIPATVTFSASAGTIFSPISVDFRNGSLLQRVTVTVTGTVGNSCQ